MRPVLLLAVAALLMAGCTSQGEPFPGRADGAVTEGDLGANADQSDDGAAGGDADAGEDDPQSDGGDGGAAGGGAPDNETSNAPAGGGAEGAANEAKGPAPVAWTLNESVALGYSAAVGTGMDETRDAPLPRQTDEAHCPEASFTMPAGAARVDVRIVGEPVDPDAQGVGMFQVRVVAPDGTTVFLEPGPSGLPEQSGMAENRAWGLDSPSAGTWTLQVEPMGPVVAQNWLVEIGAAGEALQPPAALGVVSACAAAA